MRLAPAAQRAVVVPDVALWAAAGVDIRGAAIEPVAAPPRADLLVLAANVPSGLVDAVREVRSRLPDPEAVRIFEGAGLDGPSAAEVLAEAGVEEAKPAADGEEGGGAHEHGDMEHGDHSDGGEHGDRHEGMMAVTGEPSGDGLVMEDAEAASGPLGPALATGLVWHATLDGDVVRASRIESVVGAPTAEGAPDPLARAASRWAFERADGTAALSPALVPSRLAAVEVERALSHLMWLARFSHGLGCLALADRLHAAARPLIRTHAAFLRDERVRPEASGLGEARDALRRARASRALAARTRGVAAVTADECRRRQLGGPVARAAGLRDDTRASDPAYRALGFAGARRDAGDAEARTAVRIDEALESLELVGRAVETAELPVGGGPVEGPRGPVVADRTGPSDAVVPRAPSAGTTLEVAAASAHGRELARAVVAVSSFDLSPWEVSG